MSESEDEVTLQILRKIGAPVRFNYPGEEGCKKGILKDRALITSPGSTGVPYWDVVDLIEFPGQSEPEWMRIGYYRKPMGGRLVWGSQTTITEPLTIWKALLVHAAKEMPWFKRLLDEIMEDLAE